MRLRIATASSFVAAALAVCACSDSAAPNPAFARIQQAVLGPESAVDAPAVGAGANVQEHFAAAWTGNLYFVAWSDTRMSNTGATQVWGSRLSPTGMSQDQFGLQLTYGRGGDHPAVACVPNYCWVAWTDYNQLEGVRVSAGGTILDAAPVAFSSSSATMADLSMATNGTDFFLAWTDDRSGVQSIFGRAILADAGLPGEVVVSSGALIRRRPVVVPTGSDYVVAWSDLRGTSADIWARRVLDGGGTLGPETQISTSSPTDDFVSGAADTAGDVLLTWDTAIGIIGRRMTSLLTPIDASPFAINGTTAAAARHAKTVFDGTQWVVAYEAGATQKLQVSAVSPGGSPSDPGSGLLGSTGTTPALASNDGGLTLIGWHNQHLAATLGHVNVNTTGSGLSLIAPPTLSASSQFDPDVAGIDGGFLVVWQDSRSDRLLPTARWFDRNGAAVAASFELSPSPSVASDGRGAAAGPDQAAAVWVDAASSVLRLTRIAPQGASLDVPPLNLASGFPQANPSGAWGPGSYLVVWQEPHATSDIYARRVGTTGPPGAGAFAVAAGGSAEVTPAVAGNPTQWLVAWGEGGGTRIGYTRVSAAGALLDVPTKTLFGTGASRLNPSLASDGSDFLVSWFDNGTLVVAARVKADGTVADGAPVVLAGGLSTQTPNAVWDGRRYLVTWLSGGTVLTRGLPSAGPPLAQVTVLATALAHRSGVLAFSGDDAIVAAQSSQPLGPIASMRVTTTHFREADEGVACTYGIECKSLVCQTGLCTAFDGGTPPDAGMNDAGTADAGSGGGAGGGGGSAGGGGSGGVGGGGVDRDAGLDDGGAGGGAGASGGGGGTNPGSYRVGCGCTSVSLGPGALVLLGLAARRSRRRPAI